VKALLSLNCPVIHTLTNCALCCTAGSTVLFSYQLQFVQIWWQHSSWHVSQVLLYMVKQADVMFRHKMAWKIKNGKL